MSKRSLQQVDFPVGVWPSPPGASSGQQKVPRPPTPTPKPRRPTTLTLPPYTSAATPANPCRCATEASLGSAASCNHAPESPRWLPAGGIGAAPERSCEASTAHRIDAEIQPPFTIGASSSNFKWRATTPQNFTTNFRESDRKIDTSTSTSRRRLFDEHQAIIRLFR